MNRMGVDIPSSRHVYVYKLKLLRPLDKTGADIAELEEVFSGPLQGSEA